MHSNDVTIDEEADYCEVPLGEIRDEGPLVAAAGYLTAGCASQDAGRCGPQVVLPILYCLRFSLELSIHGCIQALEEARSCAHLTERKTHDLRQLFEEWTKQMGDSSRRHGWYGKKLPELEPVWAKIEPLHLLDPDGTCLRYPKNFPTSPDVCTLLDEVTTAVQFLVDYTAPLVPTSRVDCRKRLAFLHAVSQTPCECFGRIEDFDDSQWLCEFDPTADWPPEWSLTLV